jgi:hypothetical protein
MRGGRSIVGFWCEDEEGGGGSGHVRDACMEWRLLMIPSQWHLSRLRRTFFIRAKSSLHRHVRFIG